MCECMSIMPGVTHFPSAFISIDPFGLSKFFPISFILLDEIKMLPINISFPFPIKMNDVADMKKKMIDYYKIEIPIICWNNNIYLRISINGYNNSNDIDRLVDCLKQEHIYK